MSEIPFGFPVVHRHHPRLLVSHGENLENHALYSISENQHVDLHIPELVSKQAAFTSYGWLVLIDLERRHDDDCGCCLLNILSCERIRIPHNPMRYESYQCILSRPPTEPNCYLMLLPSRLHDNGYLYFCRLGDDDFNETVKYFGNNNTVSAVSGFGGKTYVWMGDTCRLFELEFYGDRMLNIVPLVHVAEEELSTWQLPGDFMDFIIAVDDGEILLVRAILRMYCDVAYFRVFRMGKECVEELTSLGDRALFLGKHGSTVCFADGSSSSGVKRNSIYYYWCNDQNLYVYDFEDRSTTPLRPCTVKGRLFFMSWV
ncbi:hypothetical protein STAS_29925 [Striga asiatica]|uniref:KIB1-4 beta-propeller domain-containing protein n=1 Tax=Striga asiatica TaxID=4170 RepID=A0A5A7R855_STRAF|nr:hypothetical protein STAS_29925 [Striga asiatica]